MRNDLIIGIDATNIRGGGGVTHLVEMIQAMQPEKSGIQKVVVWAGDSTISKLPNRSWLTCKSPAYLNRGFLARIIWRLFRLTHSVRHCKCDVLFVPGGSYTGLFKPVVTLSQNLLPFEKVELRRFGFSGTTIRLLLLRFIQTMSFRKSDGVIFLTRYARRIVEKKTGRLNDTKLIPHGISQKFFAAPRKQFKITEYSEENPFKILYVSIVNQYKHQWHVVSAVAKLREKYSYPIELELVGPSFPPAMNRLQRQIDQDDVGHQWVKYSGSVSHDKLVEIYLSSDVGVFASSCENLPIILLETMASGVPVACSNRGPMPEVLGSAGLYFDPENPLDISNAIHKLICSPELRCEMAESSYKKSLNYSWEQCAKKTSRFLAEIASKTTML